MFLGRDLREPFLLAMEERFPSDLNSQPVNHSQQSTDVSRVFFFFFEGGVNPVDFEPLGLFKCERLGAGEWTEPEIFGHKGEVN